jgi:hypothetical protein
MRTIEGQEANIDRIKDQVVLLVSEHIMTCSKKVNAISSGLRWRNVQPLSHFLSRLKVWMRLPLDRDDSTVPRIARGPSRTMPDREGAEAPQLDTVSE